MTLYTDKQKDFSDWIKNVNAIANEIRQYLHCVDISLIVEDYIAVPVPSDIPYGKCVKCKASHKRTATDLCFTCGDICLICNEHTTNERNLYCKSCTKDKSKNMIVPFLDTFTTDKMWRKCHLYAEWYRVTFPSDVHCYHTNQIKAEAKAASDKKNTADQFLERLNFIVTTPLERLLLDSLYEVNKEINTFLDSHSRLYADGLKRKPEYPYW